jgi:hypothetical protein
MMVIIGIVLGWFVFRWASELYSWKAGILALTLYVFDPNIIAHTTIVHTDIPITAGIFIFMYYFWKYMQNTLQWKQIIVLGVLAGICFAVKFTGIYVIGFIAILLLVHLFFDVFYKEKKQCSIHEFYVYFSTNPERKQYVHALLKKIGIIFLIAVLVLATTYGFVHFNYYFEGLYSVTEHSASLELPGYLLGKHVTQGQWYYFPIAFLVKTPVPTILLVVIVFSLAYYFKKTDIDFWRNALFLFVPAILYFFAFIPSKYNIGHRHILPIYPFLFVLVGSLFTYESLLTEKYKQYKLYIIAGLLLLVLWIISTSVIAYPYYLSYFNDAVGGSEQGHKYLLDSNVDWGQGLKETAEWLKNNGYLNQTIRLGYFGNEDPKYRGITATQIVCAPTPGISVISANKLYDFMGNQYGCTDWLFNYEPVARIGYDMYIYNIQDSAVIEHYNACKTDCSSACIKKGEAYGDSIYKDKCICICDEATNEELGIL